MRSPQLMIKPNNCQSCRMSTLCLPLALRTSDLDLLDSAIQRGKPMQKNQSVFYAGDKFTSVYAIRSGAV